MSDLTAIPGGRRPDGRTLLGEVVGASYSAFTVETYELHATPPLGGLVVAEDVLGLVYDAHTEGLGPISAKGAAYDPEADVYRIHPDLSRTLRSQFSALVVAHYAPAPDRDTPPEARRLVYTLPDAPPRLHYKAWLAAPAELLRFTDKPHYLRLLLQASDCPVDEVIIHVLAHAYAVRGGDRAHLLACTETLGRLLKGQYDRLIAILETVEALTADVPPPPTSTGPPLPPSVGSVKL